MSRGPWFDTGAADRVVAAYLAGRTVREAAAECGVARATAYAAVAARVPSAVRKARGRAAMSAARRGRPAWNCGLAVACPAPPGPGPERAAAGVTPAAAMAWVRPGRGGGWAGAAGQPGAEWRGAEQRHAGR